MMRTEKTSYNSFPQVFSVVSSVKKRKGHRILAFLSNTSVMKSIVRRYDANADSEYLEDKGGKPDPDFWTNRVNGATLPVWSICGPIVRAAVEEGDILVFTPTKRSVQDRFDNYKYISTGILKVAEKLSLPQFLRDPRFNTDYKEWYVEDLANKWHLGRDLAKDNLDTAAKRADNVVVGDPDESWWFGLNEIPLQKVVMDTVDDEHAESIEKSPRQPKQIHGDPARELYDELTKLNTPIKGRPSNFSGFGECKTCRNG